MGNPYDEIKAMAGLWTHANPLNAPDGGMLVADNVEILREDMVTPRRGYRSMSGNLPAFTPQQIIVVGGVAYINIGNSLWYYDQPSSGWVLKQPSLPIFSVNHTVYATSGKLYVGSTTVIGVIDLATGAATQLAGRWGVTGTTDGTGDTARFTQIFGVWSDGNDVYAIDNQGATTVIRKITQAGVVTTITTATGSPRGIAGGGGFLYTPSSSSVYRSPISGGAQTAIVSGVSGGNQGDISLAGSTLYIGTATNGIYTAPVTGGTASQLSGTAAETVYGMTVDVNGNVYYQTLAGSLKRRDASSGAVSTIAAVGFLTFVGALTYAPETLIGATPTASISGGSLKRFFLGSGQSQAFYMAFDGPITGRPPYVTALSGVVRGPT